MDVGLGAGQRLTLSSVDPSALAAAARIDVLTELQRLRSWVDAQEQVLLAAMAGPGDVPVAAGPGSVAAGKQFVREEIACARAISPLTVNARLHVARELTRRLPPRWRCSRPGRSRCARRATWPRPPVRYPTKWWRRWSGGCCPARRTFPNFRACVQRAVLALDPRGAQDKHEAEVEQRRVESRVLENGTGSLYAALPADDLQALLVSVQACADALPAAGYPPGPHAADQRRAECPGRADHRLLGDHGRAGRRHRDG